MVRLFLAYTLLLTIAATARADEPAKTPADRQQPQVLDRTVKVNLKYLLYLPEDYEKHALWPLLLFLHGSGERGDDLQLVKKHGPPKLIEAGAQIPVHRGVAAVSESERQVLGAVRADRAVGRCERTLQG